MQCYRYKKSDDDDDDTSQRHGAEIESAWVTLKPFFPLN